MLLLVVALLALAAAAFLVSELVTLPAQERDGSLRRAAHYGRAAEPHTLLGDESLRDRAFLPLKEKLARLVLRMNPKWTIEQVSLRLLSAGLGIYLYRRQAIDSGGPGKFTPGVGAAPTVLGAWPDRSGAGTGAGICAAPCCGDAFLATVCGGA